MLDTDHNCGKTHFYGLYLKTDLVYYPAKMKVLKRNDVNCIIKTSSVVKICMRSRVI